MKPSPLLRIAPIVLVVAAAYAVGYWRASEKASSKPKLDVVERPPAEAVVAAAPEPYVAEPTGQSAPSIEETVAELDSIATAAKTISVPDARTFGFFEKLTLEELPAVVDFVRGMPPGNEQDILFVMAIQRWAALDGREAVKQARIFPALGTRNDAVLAAYTSWGAVDATGAFNHAVTEPEDGIQAAALSAAISGAATRDPRNALTLWEAAPEGFRNSPAGQNAAAQIASAAYGTDKAEAIRTIVAELPADHPARIHLINSLARQWGGHYPEDALAWVQEVMPASEERENVANTMFLALAQRDPSLAAVWAAEYPDESKRREFIAAAVQEWVRFDPPGAETWVNEQPSGPYLDGATYAMAVHFLARQDMARSFAWIRRISAGEMREQMLGTLGRLWAANKPLDFKNFLEQTSLSPIEVEMLMARIEPAS